MDNRGKNINLFLMDGDPNGRIKCTLANWTGVAYKIPRDEIDKCKNREDLKRSGIYFLFGVDQESGKNLIYIGQAGSRKNGEGILSRLLEHKRNPEKDYWTEAIAFITSNNSFGPTEISYLENKFTNLAINANRYIVKNLNEPTIGNITEEKASELEEFTDFAKIIVGTLGHKVFIPVIETQKKEHPDIEKTKKTENTMKTSSGKFNETHLYLKIKVKRENQTIKAECIKTDEGYIVLAGSQIANSESKTISETIHVKRTEAIIKNNILENDVFFRSPSAAAGFVIGAPIDGWIFWKDINGRTLDEIVRKKTI